jgi:hypothetical protein
VLVIGRHHKIPKRVGCGASFETALHASSG